MELHKFFRNGQYRAMVQAADSAKQIKAHLVSLIGALCFLGRGDEAQHYFDLYAEKISSLELIACRFFLAVGYTRRSDYQKGKQLFDWNSVSKATEALEKFYVQQGKVFFSYYTGRMDQCLEEAALAQKFAIQANDDFAKSLALDALGNSQVISGKIHSGLQTLEDAKLTAKKLGNKSLYHGIGISQALYKAEYGLSPQESMEWLESKVLSPGTEDNFSQSNLALELARQYSLRGQWNNARKTLEQVSPAIYASQNRRHEILLNLRLAEIAYQTGENFQSAHFLWFVKRLVHKEADGRFELATIGLERKLALAERNQERLAEVDQRWGVLSREFSSTRDRNLRFRQGLDRAEENREDKIHLALAAVKKGESSSYSKLTNEGFWGAFVTALQLDPGRDALVVLPKKAGFLLLSKKGVSRSTVDFTDLQFRILRVLAQAKSEVSKERLLKQVWGYSYHPLRHDSLIYAAIGSLRRSLGENAHWLQGGATGGYLFTAQFMQTTKAVARSAPAQIEVQGVDPELNFRQLLLLENAKNVSHINVPEYSKQFTVSEITALRDLGVLRTKNYVVRVGKGRATRYLIKDNKI